MCPVCRSRRGTRRGRGRARTRCRARPRPGPPRPSRSRPARPQATRRPGGRRAATRLLPRGSGSPRRRARGECGRWGTGCPRPGPRRGWCRAAAGPARPGRRRGRAGRRCSSRLFRGRRGQGTGVHHLRRGPRSPPRRARGCAATGGGAWPFTGGLRSAGCLPAAGRISPGTDRPAPRVACPAGRADLVRGSRRRAPVARCVSDPGGLSAGWAGTRRGVALGGVAPPQSLPHCPGQRRVLVAQPVELGPLDTQ